MKLELLPWRHTLLVAIVLACTMLGADCDGDIVDDPTFRDWCGDSLCSWRTDSGSVVQAPTWSADDLGVSFVTQGTTISQATTESLATCILFTTVADFDRDAQMTLGVDFDNDGVIDTTLPIPAVFWEQTQVLVTAPTPYEGITFYISKGGTGTAILAEMRIQSSTGCTAPPPALDDLKLGDGCGGTATCASPLVCSGDDVWSSATCGECSDDQPCANGATCARRAANLPLQCAPGEGKATSGTPCLANDDCTSHVCTGVSAEASGDGGVVQLDGGIMLDGGVEITGGSCSLDAGPDASARCYAPVSNAVGGTCL